MRVKKLLSSILAVCMLLSTMGTGAFADGTALPTADGGVITLTEDVTLTQTFVVGQGETVTIDLNGYTITASNCEAINNSKYDSTLTIMDSSDAGTGKIVGTIRNYGTLNITGGTITYAGDCDPEGYGAKCATIQNYIDDYGNACALNITGGTIEYTGENSSHYAIYCSGKLGSAERIVNMNITDCVVESSTNSIYGANASGTISGGTFIGDITLYNNGGKSVEINNGTFVGDITVQSRNAEAVEIYGGSFSSDVSEYLADGCVIEANEDGSYGVVNTNAAKVGDTYYETLQEALKAITEENNVVEIVNDVTITDKWDRRNTGATLTVPVTINGNGHTIKFTNEINDGYNHLAVFRPEAEATFMNLTVDMSEAIAVFQN